MKEYRGGNFFLQISL